MRFSPESQQFGNEQEEREVVRVRAGKIEGWRESGREGGGRELCGIGGLCLQERNCQRKNPLGLNFRIGGRED